MTVSQSRHRRKEAIRHGHAGANFIREEKTSIRKVIRSFAHRKVSKSGVAGPRYSRNAPPASVACFCGHGHGSSKAAYFNLARHPMGTGLKLSSNRSERAHL
jgi:hypothetical protein